jgi:hypothetical protein
MAQRPYYTLVTSLPYLQPPQKNKALPISELRLESRLDMLEEHDRKQLDEAVALIKELEVYDDDASYKATLDETLASVTHEGLKELMVERLRWRTVLAALRRRAAGEKSAPQGTDWGVDEALMAHIAAHWQHPTFRLSDQYPAMVSLVNKYIEKGQVADLTETLVDIKWDYYKQKEDKFEAFGLEAVALFVLRWKLIKRWLEQNGEESVARVRSAVDTMIEQTELGI